MGRWVVVSVVLLSLLGCEANYTGYKLFNIWPRTEEEKQIILQLSTEYPDHYDVWSLHRMLTTPLGISTAPNGYNRLTTLLHQGNISYEITIPDIMQAVKKERDWNTMQRYRKLYRTLWRTEHESYRTVDEIYHAIDRYAKKYPFIKAEHLGNTTEGRPIRGLKISQDDTKPIIWIDAGIHAREWIAPAAVLYLIDKLLTRDGQILLKKHQYIIVPLVNPDGYEYTHTTARLWRKNRSQNPGEECIGVDLNRNFPLKWGVGDGTSPMACDETYRGVEPASELESQALIKRMSQVKDQMVLYLNLHSYGQYILTPYGFTKYRYPRNYRNMINLAKRVRHAIQQRHSYIYQVGSASDLLYEAAGGADDYVAGVLNVPYTYTIELCDEGRYGFLLPPSYIKSVGEQLWTAIRVFSHYL